MDRDTQHLADSIAERTELHEAEARPHREQQIDIGPLKEVGRGTGLGLDIARRIVVERHGGTIDITSQPGATVLRVGLPLQPL